MAVAIPDQIVQVCRPNMGGSGLGMNTIEYWLPSPTLPNNTIVIPIGWFPDSGVTISVLDDSGGANVWVQDEGHQDSNQTYRAAWLRCNRAATGTQRITLSFTGGTAQFVMGCLVELWGIADTPLDGHNNFGFGSGGYAGSTSWACGTISPAVNGGLILSAGWSDQQSNFGDFTPDTNFALVAVSNRYGFALQAMVQTTATPINPTITATISGDFIALGVCYKTDNTKGTAPTAVPRPFQVSWAPIHHATQTSFHMQHPGKGDLIDIGWVGQGPAEHVDAIARQLAATPATDNKTNGYTRGALSQSTNCTAQHAYAGANPASRATTGSDFSLDVAVATADNAATVKVTDYICGASGIQFDKIANANGSQADGGAVTFGSITPSHAGGIVDAACGVNQNTIQRCTTSGWTTDSPWFDTEDGNTDELAEDNFWGHVLNAPASALAPTCNQSHMSGAGFGVADWAYSAIAFNSNPPDPHANVRAARLPAQFLYDGWLE